MDYILIKDALTPSECQDFKEFGESQYPLLKQDQLYPTRGYPGFTLKNATHILDKLATFIDQAGFDITYDYSFGTGVNFVNAKDGEKVGLHIDLSLIHI